jgi:hypothetical protein
VDEAVGQAALAQLVGLAAGADVPLLEDVDGHLVGYQHPDPDVHLPALEQHRPVNVLLDDEAQRPDHPRLVLLLVLLLLLFLLGLLL